MTKRLTLGAIAAIGVLGLGIGGAAIGQSLSNGASAQSSQQAQGVTTGQPAPLQAPSKALQNSGSTKPFKDTALKSGQTGAAKATVPVTTGSVKG